MTNDYDHGCFYREGKFILIDLGNGLIIDRPNIIDKTSQAFFD